MKKKALINFANWGRGGENERKREFHLRRVRAGKGVRDKQKNVVTHWISGPSPLIYRQRGPNTKWLRLGQGFTAIDVRTQKTLRFPPTLLMACEDYFACSLTLMQAAIGFIK